MNIFHKVTLQALKKNRVRTVVTIVGILLSAAMITAVTTFASTLRNYMLQNTIYENGRWHGRTYDASAETCDRIGSSKEIKSSARLEQLGYAVAEGCQNLYKPYFYVLGADDEAIDMLQLHLTSGRFPTSPDEIALPDHLEWNGGLRYAPGDVLTLGLGERLLNGNPLGPLDALVTDEDLEQPVLEELSVREERTYTVVGFFERPGYGIEDYTSPGFTAITRMDPTPAESRTYEVYFELKNPKNVYSFMELMQLPGRQNSSVLALYGVSIYTNYLSVLYKLAAIVILLILLGSVSLIYNAFSISVSERTRQFGLLSSIGATKKQLRRMVYFEALCACSIGIPLGILSGVAGIGLTLVLIGDKFRSFGYPLPLILHVSVPSIIAAAVISLITVLISAWIPSRRGSRVSAVEAIRQNQDIRLRGKQKKNSRLTYRLFGLPGILASQYYRRNRKKYRITVLSLFMSIVLFISVSVFSDYLMESAHAVLQDIEWDLRLYANVDEQQGQTVDEMLRMLSEADAVTGAVCTQYCMVTAYAPADCLSPEAPAEILDDGSAVFSVILYFIDDASYRSLLENEGIDPEPYMQPDAPVAVVANRSTTYDNETGRWENISYLNSDSVTLRFPEYKEIEGYYPSEIEVDGRTVIRYYVNGPGDGHIDYDPEEVTTIHYLQTGKRIGEVPFELGNSGRAALLYPLSCMTSVLPESYLNSSYNFLIYSDNHAESYSAIQDALKERNIPQQLYDDKESAEYNQNMVVILQIFAYGFIVLISLIAAANVFNTISTNVSLRRREFAMLKSVGLSSKGLNRMMNYECLLYGSRSLILGLPVSGFVAWLIWKAVTDGYDAAFRLPWKAFGIATFSVFAVVFATMMYSMRKIKKDNPIDALKNENL